MIQYLKTLFFGEPPVLRPPEGGPKYVSRLVDNLTNIVQCRYSQDKIEESMYFFPRGSEELDRHQKWCDDNIKAIFSEMNEMLDNKYLEPEDFQALYCGDYRESFFNGETNLKSILLSATKTKQGHLWYKAEKVVEGHANLVVKLRSVGNSKVQEFLDVYFASINQ